MFSQPGELFSGRAQIGEQPLTRGLAFPYPKNRPNLSAISETRKAIQGHDAFVVAVLRQTPAYREQSPLRR